MILVYKVFGIIFLGLGILCILYCLGISLDGFGTYFFLIWSVIGAFFIGVALLFFKPNLWQAIPLWMKTAGGIIIGIGLLLFVVVEGMVLSQFSKEPVGEPQYCIILGAQWKTSGPSIVLQYRLDKAIEFLEEHSDTKVIVSGGKGSNEPISEAEGMFGYLVEAGIPEDRIIMEDRSTNTYENLIFSEEYLEKTADSIVLVTNNFHMFRALKIAQKQGYENIQGLAAKSSLWFMPNNLLREFVGVMKDFLMGNL